MSGINKPLVAGVGGISDSPSLVYAPDYKHPRQAQPDPNNYMDSGVVTVFTLVCR
jgi:hypothetical protein